jgi:hypothetical protein
MNIKRVLAACCTAAVLTIAASGCGSAAKKAVDHELKRNGVDINEKDSSVTIKDDSGNALTYGSDKLPEGWPDELAMPDGTTIITALKNASSSGEVLAVSVGSKKSVKDFVKALSDELSDAGWKKDQSLNYGGGTTDESQTVSYKKNGKVVVIIATSTTESDFKSNGQITVAPSDDDGSSDSGGALSS